jgi:hypothetical protein
MRMTKQESSNINKSSHTKKRMHGFAVSSGMLAVTGLLIPYTLWYIAFGLCWDAEWIDLLFAQILAVVSLISFIGSGGVSIFFGIIAILKIKRSNGTVSGIGVSIAGTIGGIAILVIFGGVAEALFWIFKGMPELFV